MAWAVFWDLPSSSPGSLSLSLSSGALWWWERERDKDESRPRFMRRLTPGRFFVFFLLSALSVFITINREPRGRKRPGFNQPLPSRLNSKDTSLGVNLLSREGNSQTGHRMPGSSSISFVIFGYEIEEPPNPPNGSLLTAQHNHQTRPTLTEDQAKGRAGDGCLVMVVLWWLSCDGCLVLSFYQ